MTLKSAINWLAVAAGLVAVWFYVGDKLSGVISKEKVVATVIEVAPPAVTVATVKEANFVETVLVTGSLVAREEVQVAPEVDGFKVVDIKVDQGDQVKKGDILAILVAETLDAQLAQNTASNARGDAAIAQAKSHITEVEARLSEANAALERARPLKKSGYMSESVFDQRQALARAATAQLAAARDALRAAEAEKDQTTAQRRELDWRRGNAEVRAPADGLISRRGARLGAIASSANSASEPLFRIIANGEIELDAEVSEAQVTKLKIGQTAKVVAAGGIEATGKIRLISPEIDPATRLGRVRIFLGAAANLRVGAFARGTIETAAARGLAVPVSAISYGPAGATLQKVVGGIVETTAVTTGLATEGIIEIKSGLNSGDVVVARAGTFLRNGDKVRAIPITEERVSTVE